jgi:hypothetical protein
VVEVKTLKAKVNAREKKILSLLKQLGAQVFFIAPP